MYQQFNRFKLYRIFYNIKGIRIQQLTSQFQLMKAFTQKQSATEWLKTYQVQDLSRCLIREFLIQNQLVQTLNCFEKQDKREHKKINKSILIKMLSLNNLVFGNKFSEKPFKSLVEILVSYLKDKFVARVEGGQRSEKGIDNTSHAPSHKTQNQNKQSLKRLQETQRGKVQKSLNNSANMWFQKDSKDKKKELAGGFMLQQKIKPNQRPYTAKNGQKKKNTQLIYAELQKQDIKEKQKLIQLQKSKQQQEKRKRQKERKKKQQEEQRMRKIVQQQNRAKQIQKLKQQEAEKQRQAQIQKQKERKAKQQQRKAQEQRKKQRQLRIKRQQEQKLRIKQEQEEKQRQRKQQQQKIQKQRKQQQRKRVQQKFENQRKAKAKLQEQQKLLKKKQQQEQKNNKQQQFLLQQRKKVEINNKNLNQPPDAKEQQQKKPETNFAQSGNLKLQSKASIQQQSKKQEQTNFVLQNNENKKQESKQKMKSQQPKMVKMFGRKKKNNLQQLQKKEESSAQKFKFDENFVDQPLREQPQKYDYQKIQFNKITVKNPEKAEINYREKPNFGQKKYQQKAITQAQSQDLKKAVFQNGPSTLPKSWFQGFILSPHPNTPYGLQQIQGGPCGIIAAVQCYFLKHLLHLAQPSQQEMNNQIIRQNCLVAAIADMLFKVKSTDKIILALPPKSFSGTKIDLSNLRLVTIDASTFPQAFEGIWSHRTYFNGKTNHGVAVLMYCVVMTKSIQKIWQQIDMKQNPLIGNHGHCTQQLVNLFITGHASSNCFDGIKIIDSQIKLKGIQNKSQFGFLTIFQTLRYIQVGKNLKNPIYPFWIICKQFHYHVVFANNYQIGENNNIDKFDIVYFDGLYNCADRIVITLEKMPRGQFGQEIQVKIKDLPLIQQVLMTKWGKRMADWNGSIKIL